MFNIGAGELVVILVVGLLVLGPKRLPELARALGRFLREVRRHTNDVRSVVEREFYGLESDGANPLASAGSALSPRPLIRPLAFPNFSLTELCAPAGTSLTQAMVVPETTVANARSPEPVAAGAGQAAPLPAAEPAEVAPVGGFGRGGGDSADQWLEQYGDDESGRA